jgi:hypothetical protein
MNQNGGKTGVERAEVRAVVFFIAQNVFDIIQYVSMEL